MKNYFLPTSRITNKKCFDDLLINFFFNNIYLILFICAAHTYSIDSIFLPENLVRVCFTEEFCHGDLAGFW